MSISSDEELLMIIIENKKQNKMVISWRIDENCEIQSVECQNKFELLRDCFGK